MSVNLTVVTTSKDVEDQLDKLADNISKKALTRGMGKVLTPILNLARRFAPNRSGIVRKSLTKKVKRYSSGTVVGLVGVDASYADTYKGKKEVPNNILHFLEDGTKPHQQPKRGRGVLHPGSAPRPVIKSANDSIDREQIATTFAVEVQAQIDTLTSKQTK